MQRNSGGDAKRRHESIDHADPTDAGLMEPDADEVPGTGIMGDETLVRDLDGDPATPPGIYPAPAAVAGGVAHPGPTPEAVADALGENPVRG